MHPMRPWRLVIAGGALLVAGCQIIAGVRADAELNQGGNGGQACSASPECQSGVCQDGICKPAEAKCALDLEPFDILTSGDLGGHEVDTSSLVLASGPDRVFVSVVDKAASRLVIGTVHEIGEPAGSKAEFPFTDGAAFVTGRETGGQVILQGRVGYEIGQLVFPATADGVSSRGTFHRFPALAPECSSPSVATSMAFVQAGDSTLYAATCAAPGGSTRALVVGGSAEPAPTLVAQGPRTDASLNVHYYTVTNGRHLLLLDDNATGEAFFRTGASRADLGAAHRIQFSPSPDEVESFFGAFPLPEGDGVTLLMVHLVPPPRLTLSAEVGVVKDFLSLGQVPPPGFTPVFKLQNVNQYNPPGPVASDGENVYLALVPPPGKSVNLGWFTRTGENVLPNQLIFSLPDGSSAQILGSTVAQLGVKLLVAWIEQREGAYSVRGQRLICTLQ
ncbi:hypothetical protein [Sorangium atrum]|uniref:Lipoprotein n=1 Tax=Sorangium atrum TaxID=2995308 RepID=A0ABT5CBA9_9BACT|nr:hypothetical protein [Sorangium aterium]MDC0682928.1 hypothetical protein [Sorangium aterium]